MKLLRLEVEEQLKKNEESLLELDRLDNLYQQTFNVTLDELDFFAENMSDYEIDILNGFCGTFTQKKQALQMRNKYLEFYNKKKNE